MRSFTIFRTANSGYGRITYTLVKLVRGCIVVDEYSNPLHPDYINQEMAADLEADRKRVGVEYFIWPACLSSAWTSNFHARWSKDSRHEFVDWISRDPYHSNVLDKFREAEKSFLGL